MYLISLAAEFMMILIGEKKTNSRNTVPQVIVSQNLASGVGEVIELRWWGARCWWKLCMFGVFLAKSWTIFTTFTGFDIN